jgi:protein-tyrosine phosphatase
MRREAKKVIGVLFVCLGNICRSPLAEGVFRQVVGEAGLADRFEIDSAGTSSYHTGSPPDSRTTAVARRRGLALDHAARQITAEDLDRYDYIVVMDESNHERVRRLAESVKPEMEILLLRDFDPEADGSREVPDPYFGGESGFEEVHDMVERACRGLLEHLRERHGL